MQARRSAVRARHRQGDAGGRGRGRRRAAADRRRRRAASTRWAPRWPGSASRARSCHSRPERAPVRRRGRARRAGGAWRDRPRRPLPAAGRAGAAGAALAGARPARARPVRRGMRRGRRSSTSPTCWRRWMPRASSAATWSGTASAGCWRCTWRRRAPERVGQAGAARPGDRAARPGDAGGGRGDAARRGLGERGGGARRGAAEGRPPQALPFVEADLDEALERGRGRPLPAALSAVRRWSRAWSEMARPPASLAGFGGRAAAGAGTAATAWSATGAAWTRCERDLGDRLTRAGPRGRAHGLLGRVRRDGRRCCVVAVRRRGLRPPRRGGRCQTPLARPWRSVTLAGQRCEPRDSEPRG